MILRNSYPHPYMTGVVLNHDKSHVSRDGLTYTAVGVDSGWVNFVPMDAMKMAVGMVHVMHITGEYSYTAGSWENLMREGDWIATLVKNTQFPSIWISNGKSATIDRVALYTPADWAKVRDMWEAGELADPWFAWDTMPR